MDREQPGVVLSDKSVSRITVGATVAALAFSYRNQLDFATQRAGYPVWLAFTWPLMIDSFVIVGELRLFTATARDEGWRIKAWAWTLVLLGLAISVLFGVAHTGLPAWIPAEKLAAAVPPLAAAASLGTGLGIVKLRAREAGRAVASSGSGEGAGTAAQQSPRGTAPTPAPARSRARHLGQATPPPSAEVLAQMISADQLAGLRMGRRAFAKRHKDEGVTEHIARTALDAVSNGH